jgi:hypothetical protein
LHHSRATIVLPPIAKHEGEREARAPEFSDKVDLDMPPTEMEVNHPYLLSIGGKKKEETMKVSLHLWNEVREGKKKVKNLFLTPPFAH